MAQQLDGVAEIKTAVCSICAGEPSQLEQADIGRVRGHTKRFKEQLYTLWKCPGCQSLHSLDPVDEDIYRDYPLSKRPLDYFDRMKMKNLLRRLQSHGLKKTHAIMDYGCGGGLFVQFLKESGFTRVVGYDPFVDSYAQRPEDRPLFDCVVAQDVIEHTSDPKLLVADCLRFLKPGGLLYIGTPTPAGIDMKRLEKDMWRLHQPFHRCLVNETALFTMCESQGGLPLAVYRTSSLDTLAPFVNFRFVSELSHVIGDVFDNHFAPDVWKKILRHPQLIFWGLFGFFFPIPGDQALVATRRIAVRKTDAARATAPQKGTTPTPGTQS